MKFGIVLAKTKLFIVAEYPSLEEAEKFVGLKPGQVDFGAIGPQHAIIVYEHGLYETPENIGYFALGPNLYAGNAVLIESDRDGETVDFSVGDPGSILRFYSTTEQIERDIKLGIIFRPSTAINGVVYWEWNKS